MDNFHTLVHIQDWKDYKSHYIFEVNGHGMIRVTQYNNEFELSDLFIKDGYRQQGMGTHLLNEAINYCKELADHGKIIISTNENSEKFADDWYKKVGFIFDHIETPICYPFEETEDLEWSNVYKMEF